MTPTNAALQAEEILGFPVTARRRANETNRKKRFIIGSQEKNVVWWADSFENILKQLQALNTAGKLDAVREYVRPSPVPPEAVPTSVEAAPVIPSLEAKDEPVAVYQMDFNAEPPASDGVFKRFLKRLTGP